MNGAGKTTMMKMLTGDEPLTSGDATVDGCSVYRDMALVRQVRVLFKNLMWSSVDAHTFWIVWHLKDPSNNASATCNTIGCPYRTGFAFLRCFVHAHWH